jgi:hypothetical protein
MAGASPFPYVEPLSEVRTQLDGYSEYPRKFLRLLRKDLFPGEPVKTLLNKAATITRARRMLSIRRALV